jgi:hypothetical protein
VPAALMKTLTRNAAVRSSAIKNVPLQNLIVKLDLMRQR